MVVEDCAVTPEPRQVLNPCREEGVDEDLLCGALEVLDNRNTMTRRKIPLNVVVLPAKGDNQVPDPLFQLEGWSGSALR